MRIAATVFPPMLSIACAVPMVNPSFPVTRAEAAVLLKKEAATPQQLERPLVILGGFLDIGVGPAFYARKLKPYLRGEPVRISFVDCLTFEACRRRVVATVDRAFGGGDANETIEVDVIGQSMGGLVAMHAALEDPALGKRLKIRRLFTISSPLRGASRAARMPLDVLPLTRDMRPGSEFYSRLARTPPKYEIFSYTRLGDWVVGERYASLPGRGVWWVDTPPFESAHAGVFGDGRVLLDIVRRLRNEEPVALDPPAPLPTTRKSGASAGGE